MKKRISVRFDEQDLKMLQKDIKVYGYKNLSDFIRIKALEKEDLSNKKLILDLCFQIRKIGVNLNQLTKKVNQLNSNANSSIIQSMLKNTLDNINVLLNDSSNILK